MNKKQFLEYFSKQLNEVGDDPEAKLYYGITDDVKHELMYVLTKDLDQLFLKIVNEEGKMAYPAGTEFRLPWFDFRTKTQQQRLEENFKRDGL